MASDSKTKSIFSKNLKRLISIKGKNQKEVAKDLRLPLSAA